MIYIDEDPVKYAENIGIDTTPIDCPYCKKTLKWEKIIAFRGYRGIETEKCCGKGSPFRCIPVSPEKIKFWEQFRSQM